MNNLMIVLRCQEEFPLFGYPVFHSGQHKVLVNIEVYHYQNSYDLMVRIIQKYTTRDV
jgi:hypothetical protein